MDTIKTDRPVLPSRADITDQIATFWNKTSEGFRTVWGPHIHHGYFEGRSETPIEAQEKLIDKLAALLEISSQDKILDAGCGMGGSSLHLAKRFHATVIGISSMLALIALGSREEIIGLATLIGLSVLLYLVQVRIALVRPH